MVCLILKKINFLSKENRDGLLRDNVSKFLDGSVIVNNAC